MTTQYQAQSDVLVFRQPNAFSGLSNVYEINSINMEIRDGHMLTFPASLGKALAERHIKAANVSLSKQIKSGTGYFIDAADLGEVESGKIQYILFCDDEFYAAYLATAPLSVRAERFVFSASTSDEEIKSFIVSMSREINAYCKSNGLKDAMGFVCNARAMDLNTDDMKTFVLVCNDDYYTGYQAQSVEEEQPLPYGA